MKVFAIIIVVMLFSTHAYGQSVHGEDQFADFNSKGVGLTETLLRFADQQHLPIAIEFVDSDSINQPIEVSLRNETIARALDSILSHGHGYAWTLQNGIIEIKNKHSSKRAERQFNTVIPLFKIAAEETVVLWRELQVALDPSLRSQGFAGHIMGSSSVVKPATSKKRTVRQILAYIVLNSAQGWIVAGPPKCLGFTPYCGLWYLMDSASAGTSHQMILPRVRENL